MLTWIKAVVPVAMAAGGVVLAVSAPSASTVAASPDAWIDSPATGGHTSPGPVIVIAHAADLSKVTSLTLAVDGHAVATDAALKHDGNLAFARFTWQATGGDHLLTVSGNGVTSTAHEVEVTGPKPAPTTLALGTPSALPHASPTPSSSATPSATPTPTPSSTPGPTASAAPSRTSSPVPTMTRSAPTHSPTPRPTTAPAPAISSFTVSSAEIERGSCNASSPTSVTLTVHATHATSVTVLLTAQGHGSKAVTLTGSGTFTATVSAESLFAADDGLDQDTDTNGTCSGRAWSATATAHGNGSATRSSSFYVGYSSYKP